MAEANTSAQHPALISARPTGAGALRRFPCIPAAAPSHSPTNSRAPLAAHLKRQFDQLQQQAVAMRDRNSVFGALAVELFEGRLQPVPRLLAPFAAPPSHASVAGELVPFAPPSSRAVIVSEGNDAVAVDRIEACAQGSRGALELSTSVHSTTALASSQAAAPPPPPPPPALPRAPLALCGPDDSPIRVSCAIVESVRTVASSINQSINIPTVSFGRGDVHVLAPSARRLSPYTKRRRRRHSRRRHSHRRHSCCHRRALRPH